MSASDARDRFATATTRHLIEPLPGGVTLRHVDAAAWHAVVDPIWQSTQDRPGLDLRPLFTPETATQMADVEAVLAGRLEHRVLFEAGGEVIGGYWGAQDTEARYCMVVSVFNEAWRGRGLYSAFLPRVVAAVAESGFREVYSRHRADNNAILVPKLRAGFVIAGVEVNPRWGLTVHLRRYLVDDLRLVHACRVDGAHASTLRARGLKLP